MRNLILENIAKVCGGTYFGGEKQRADRKSVV